MRKLDLELYVITARVPRLGRDHLDVARAAIEGGASILQLRDKDLSTRELIATVEELLQLTRPADIPLLINDRVDVALAAGAQGVHLGEDDMPIETARRLLGDQAIIGASAASVAEARAAQAAGADYLGVGAMFSSPSKADAGEPIGPEAIREINAAVGLPIVGIGGISLENAAQVIAAGAAGIAVISAVAEAENMVIACRALLAIAG